MSDLRPVDGVLHPADPDPPFVIELDAFSAPAGLLSMIAAAARRHPGERRLVARISGVSIGAAGRLTMSFGDRQRIDPDGLRVALGADPELARHVAIPE